MNRKILFGGAAAALVVAFVVGALVYNSERSQQATQAAAKNAPALARFHAPTRGAPDAKVHIVEFIDPACETCRSFYPYVKEMLAANPGRVRLSIRHVPFHPGSDQVVKVLEATRKQNKYWESLEALLAAQPYWVVNHQALPDRIWKPLEGLGLDFAQLRIDMDAPEVAQRIAQDMADAKALDVTQTPEYFVNGRPLPSFGLEQLQDLVKASLKAAY
jgi:protein-disulfide isomerase